MGQATEIADELQRLCCAETEGKFFDYVTESVGTICELLREHDLLRSRLLDAPYEAEGLRVDLIACENRTE